MTPTRRPHRAAVLALALAGVTAVAGCAAGGAPAGAGTSGAAASASTSASASSSAAPTTDPAAQARVDAALAALETEFDARVGVSAVDTGDGRSIEHRADERFLYASSLKALAAAALLDVTTADDLAERATWTAADVAAAGYSPVTELHVADGLSYAELAEAAVRKSDNTALNLVLDRVGGPAALDAWLTDLGDDETEVVDREPELNRPTAGSDANTTTPAAFTADLRSVAVGDGLEADDRAQLLDWMSGNATGDALVRAGAPDGWVVADKSGGAGGVRNDVAVVTPPGREPIVLSVLTARNDADADYDDALVARAAAAVLAELG
jgi:beta-lactamase class A